MRGRLFSHPKSRPPEGRRPALFHSAKLLDVGAVLFGNGLHSIDGDLDILHTLRYIVKLPKLFVHALLALCKRVKTFCNVVFQSDFYLGGTLLNLRQVLLYRLQQLSDSLKHFSINHSRSPRFLRIPRPLRICKGLFWGIVLLVFPFNQAAWGPSTHIEKNGPL